MREGFLKGQLELLESVKPLIQAATGVKWEVAFPLIHSIQDSTKSLLMLAQFERNRDCYVIGRTVFETVVNLCFILGSPDEVAGRAKRHALQKSYRDLNREFGGIKIT